MQIFTIAPRSLRRSLSVTVYWSLIAVFCGLLLRLTVVASNDITTAEPAATQPAIGSPNLGDEVFVPAGTFLMGCSNDLFTRECDIDTHPVHGVYLDDFYIDRTEVTNAQYRTCEAAGACLPPLSNKSETRNDYYTNPDYDNYPVIQVDWHRAKAYCQWAGKRLPTEAEWEKAARGTDLRMYPWGNEDVSCERANYMAGIWPHYHHCVGDTVAVGSYPENVGPYGALDMAGNVSEWVNDLYQKLYYRDSPYYNPQGPEEGVEHLLRGGSWREDYGGVTLFVRLDGPEIYNHYRIGFRCARSGPPPTPRPTPTPTPTPTPFAVGDIGPDGGALWLANPEHLTLLSVAPGVMDMNTTFTIAFDGRSNIQTDLQGIDHFFYLDASPSISESETVSIPGTLDSLNMPLKLTLGFTRSNLYGVIAETLDLYRLGPTSWLTTDIAVVERAGSYFAAWVGHTGVYGLMGRTNRLYLPIILRGGD